MARVVLEWPDKRTPPAGTMEYPWKDWTNGSIWIADQGIDFPANTCTHSFRAILYGYAQRHTRIRQRKMDEKVARLREQGKTIRRVPKTKALKVLVRIVSDTQVSWQFYNEGDDVEKTTPDTQTLIPRQKRAMDPPTPKRAPVNAGTLNSRKRKALV